jgi:hypothetical protein
MVEYSAGDLAEVLMRFTIRELFLLTVIVALSVGWWLDHRRLMAIDLYLRQHLGISQHDFPASKFPPRSWRLKSN